MLGRRRVFANEFLGGDEHAAEVLRPRAVESAVDDDMPDVARAQVLRVGRQGEERVDLALDEKLLRGRERAGHPLDVLGGIEPDIGGHAGDQRLRHQSATHLLALQISNAADAFVRKQRIASDVHSPASTVAGEPASIAAIMGGV